MPVKMDIIEKGLAVVNAVGPIRITKREGDIIMSDIRIPQPGDFYLHFKHKLYQIITVAIHSETRESLVIYQALYGDYKTFARPLDMFLSEVDHEKYPDVQQKYRFQYITPEELSTLSQTLQGIPSTPAASVQDVEPKKQKEEVQSGSVESTVVESKRIERNQYRFIDSNPKTLNDFLDADSDRERLEILHQMRSYVDLFTLDSIAVCLDYVPDGESVEERYLSICKYLEMKITYESKRGF